jgi:hypothetical protein
VKLINFRCSQYGKTCSYEEDQLFSSSEEAPRMLEHYCPMCGGILRKFNFKNNPQRVFIEDTKDR